MQLTENHIQELYKFTRQHFVEHYDVQTELVDHLANDIEEICKENPKLTFEQARDKSFKKFGVFGFMEVVEEKQKEMNKYYWKIIWRFAKEWFSIPKILITVSVFFSLYFILHFKTGANIFSGILLLTAIFDVFYATKLRKIAKNRFKEKGKKWMLEDMIFNTAAFSGVMISSQLPNLYHNLVKGIPSKTTIIILSFLVTISLLYSYIALLVIPKKTEELLSEKYPEYKLA